jgi:hypothetical protein
MASGKWRVAFAVKTISTRVKSYALPYPKSNTHAKPPAKSTLPAFVNIHIGRLIAFSSRAVKRMSTALDCSNLT